MLPEKKGEEMKSRSKGNFFDFMKDVMKNLRLQRKFLLGYRKGLSAKDLLGLFYRLGYEGVTLEDCEKMLIIIKDPKQFKKLCDLQY